jgi:hypothetical protein
MIGLFFLYLSKNNNLQVFCSTQLEALLPYKKVGGRGWVSLTTRYVIDIRPLLLTGRKAMQAGTFFFLSFFTCELWTVHNLWGTKKRAPKGNILS